MATGTIKGNSVESFSLSFGSMVSASDRIANCYKCGRIVSINIQIKITATTAKTISDLFTIPSGYRPYSGIFFAAIDNTNDLVMNGSISASTGGCTLYRNHTTSMSAVRLGVTYICE